MSCTNQPHINLSFQSFNYLPMFCPQLQQKTYSRGYYEILEIVTNPDGLSRMNKYTLPNLKHYFNKSCLTRVCWSRWYPSGSSRRILYPCRSNKCSAWVWILPPFQEAAVKPRVPGSQTPYWGLTDLRGWPQIWPRHGRHLVLHRKYDRNQLQAKKNARWVNA